MQKFMFVAVALMVVGFVGVARSTAPAPDMGGSLAVDIMALQSNAQNLPATVVENPL